MALFKKNKKVACANCSLKFDSEELRDKHFAEAHDSSVENVPVGLGNVSAESSNKDPSLQDIIMSQTELWYKEQVILCLNDVIARLERLEKIANGEDIKP